MLHNFSNLFQIVVVLGKLFSFRLELFFWFHFNCRPHASRWNMEATGTLVNDFVRSFNAILISLMMTCVYLVLLWELQLATHSTNSHAVAKWICSFGNYYFNFLSVVPHLQSIIALKICIRVFIERTRHPTC